MAGSSAGSIFVDLLLRDVKFSQGLRNSSKSLKTFERDALASIKGVGAAFAGLASAREIIRISDQFITISSRMKIFEGDADKAAIVLDKLYKVSQRNYVPLDDTANSYIRLSQSLNDYQKSQYDTVQISELLAQTLRLSGTSAEDAGIFYKQFGQAASSDFKAIGQELQTFADQNPVLYGILRKEAEKTGMTLKDFAAEGKLSYDLFAKALVENTDLIQSQIKGLDRTVSSALNNLFNGLQMYISQSSDVSQSSNVLIAAIDGITAAFDFARENAISLTTAGIGLLSLFYDLSIQFKKMQIETAVVQQSTIPLLAKVLGNDAAFIKQKLDEIKDYQDRQKILGQGILDSTKLPEDKSVAGTGAAKPAGLNAAAQKELDKLLEQNSYLINGNTKALQKYKDTQADLKKLLDGGKITMQEYNAALAQLKGDFDTKSNKSSIDDLNQLYEKNSFLINGNKKELQDYIDTQAELQKLLDAGKITVDQYYLAWAQLTQEYQDNKKNVNAWGIDITEFGKRAASNIQDAFADFLFDPFESGLKGMAKGFVDTVRKMIAEAQAAQLAKSLFGSLAGGEGGGLLGGGLKSIFGSIFGQSGSAGIDNISVGAMKGLIPMYADGGYLGPGEFGIAGEAGAELLYGGKTGVSIFNQDQMASGRGGGNTYAIDARGTDSSVILRLQQTMLALAGPGVIEQRVMDAQRRGQI